MVTESLLFRPPFGRCKFYSLISHVLGRHIIHQRDEVNLVFFIDLVVFTPRRKKSAKFTPASKYLA